MAAGATAETSEKDGAQDSNEESGLAGAEGVREQVAGDEVGRLPGPKPRRGGGLESVPRAQSLSSRATQPKAWCWCHW